MITQIHQTPIPRVVSACNGTLRSHPHEDVPFPLSSLLHQGIEQRLLSWDQLDLCVIDAIQFLGQRLVLYEDPKSNQ